MYFVRRDDGTGFYGDLCWDWRTVTENRLRFQLNDSEIPAIEEIYPLFGVCTALQISPEKAPLFGTFEPLYEFLYGQPIETFLLNDHEPASFLACLSTEKPLTWTQSMVESMDWDLFCLSYYTFLYSKSDFCTQIWEALETILGILQQNPALLTYLLTKNGRYSDLTLLDFWETVYDGLYKKVIFQLDEKRCYEDYRCLKKVESILPEFVYQPLEHECCAFFDEIARKRIDNVPEESYTVGELVNFDIEKLFFYKEYFALPSSYAETKEYVLTSMYNFFSAIGNRILAKGDLIGADDVYIAALKYAQISSEKEVIIEKRSNIAQAVNEARMAEAHRQAVAELEWKMQDLKDNAKDIFVKILAAIFLISIPTTIVFGILTFLKVFSFSKVVFLVSGCIMMLFIVALTAQAIKDRRQQRKSSDEH
jgi:hypothetical protein